jgi:predicted nucleic acid-binding protein
MSAAQFLIDTSALARFLRGDSGQYGWDRAAAAGLIATCPVTELEFFYSARSAEDRARGIEDMRLLFGWVPVDDRAYDRAWRVQELLTRKGPPSPVNLSSGTAPIPGNSLTAPSTVRPRRFSRISVQSRDAIQPLCSPGRPRSSTPSHSTPRGWWHLHNRVPCVCCVRTTGLSSGLIRLCSGPSTATPITGSSPGQHAPASAHTVSWPVGKRVGGNRTVIRRTCRRGLAGIRC